MKKTIIMMLGLALMSVQSFANTRAQALLLHNGQGMSFDADQLQEAINEAVAGDTICLSEGAFFAKNDTLLIDKAISLIGAGAEVTKISGNIKVAIDGNPALTSRLMDGIQVAGSFEIYKDVRGVSLSKCWIGSWFQAVDCEARDIKIESCFLYQFPMLEGTFSSTIVNSIIVSVGKVGSVKIPCQEGRDIYFINCHIVCLMNCNWAANYTNCIIGGYGYYSTVTNNSFTNCLLNSTSNYLYLPINTSNCNINYNIYSKTNTGNLRQNCYQYGFQVTADKDRNLFPAFSITNELLQSNEFFGTDGTIIGAYGGATPYTLKGEGLEIKESVLRVDPATRQLNVTLKLGSK